MYCITYIEVLSTTIYYIDKNVAMYMYIRDKWIGFG